MITSLLIGSLALAGLQGQPTALARKFAKGEKLSYEVSSSLLLEERVPGLVTFMPSNVKLNYAFTTEVLEMKADGIAVLRYLRPTIVVTEGETFDSPPKTVTEKVNYNFVLTVSPVNEIMAMEEKAKAAKWSLPIGGGMQQSYGETIADIHRLALFAGSFDNALDFTPKLPFSEVKPGDTWSRTVSYHPQKLKGTSETVVQRLDYKYVYKGLVSVNGKQFQRVEATLKINNDLASFYNQYIEQGPGNLRIAKLPIKLDAKVEYDLDPKLGHVVAARAESQGSSFITLSDFPNRRLHEQKLKGRTTMTLKTALPAKG